MITQRLLKVEQFPEEIAGGVALAVVVGAHEVQHG